MLNLSAVRNFKETENAMRLKMKDSFSKDLHQIEIDLKRLKKEFRTFKNEDITFMFENILLLFVQNYPWVGYVQGMSDILVPIVHVFCEENILTAEASSFFVFINLIKRVYYNFIENQPGILTFLQNFAMLLQEKDRELFDHLKKEKVIEHFYAFRWINCLFTREFNLEHVYLVYDAMLSSDTTVFLEKFSVSFLLFFKDLLMKKDFNSILLFLQEIDGSFFKQSDVVLLLNNSFD